MVLCAGLSLEEVNDCVRWMYPFALVVSRDGPVAQGAFPGVSFIYEIREHVPNSLSLGYSSRYPQYSDSFSHNSNAGE